MIKIDVSPFKKKEPETVEKLTDEEHQCILMHFIRRIIKEKDIVNISFILSHVYDNIDNNSTYFLKTRINAGRNLHAINALISIMLDVFTRFLKKENVVLLAKRVKYKREFRKSQQRLKIEKEDFDKFYTFFEKNNMTFFEGITSYSKNKYGLEKKISNKETIFSKSFTAIELYLFCCLLLNLKPLKEHVSSGDEILEISDLLS